MTLFASVILLFLYIFSQSGSATRERGVAWNVGPRDETAPLKTGAAERMARSAAGFYTIYPAFLLLYIVLTIGGMQAHAEICGGVWLIGQVIALVASRIGVSALRLTMQVISFVALILMLGCIILMFLFRGWNNAPNIVYAIFFVVILFFIHLLVQAVLNRSKQSAERGIAIRAAQAFADFRIGFMILLAFMMMIALWAGMGRFFPGTNIGGIAALIWFFGQLIALPLSLVSAGYGRSVSKMLSIAGIVLMLAATAFGIMYSFIS